MVSKRGLFTGLALVVAGGLTVAGLVSRSNNDNVDPLLEEREKYACVFNHQNLEKPDNHSEENFDKLQSCYDQTNIDNLLRSDIKDPVDRDEIRGFMSEMVDIFYGDTSEKSYEELVEKDYFNLMEEYVQIRVNTTPNYKNLSRFPKDTALANISEGISLLDQLRSNDLENTEFYNDVFTRLRDYTQLRVESIDRTLDEDKAVLDLDGSSNNISRTELEDYKIKFLAQSEILNNY